MNDTVMRFTARALAALPIGLDVVEFGSRIVNGTVRSLFPAGTRYVGVDLQEGPGVDVVADAVTWGEPESADCVVCHSMLEHATAPGAVVRNTHRLLRPGGCLLLSAPCEPYGPHGCDGGAVGEEWYRNVSVGELADWAAEFSQVQVERSRDHMLLLVATK